MVHFIGAGAIGAGGDVRVAQAEAPDFEKVNWKKEPHLRKLYALCAVLMIASATTGYDGTLLNVSQQINAWDSFFRPEIGSRHLLGIMVNMFNIGSIISFLLTPYLADNFGRKTAIIIGCSFMIVGGLLTAFAKNYNMYISGRIIIGFGNSFAQMCAPMLLTEICHPQHRGPVTAIYNCLWNVGAFFVVCIGWGTSSVQSEWAWRSVTLFQVVPSIIQLSFIWFVPESPRYLISKDRNEEALEILAEYHGGGDENNATVQFEYQEITQTINLEKSLGTQSSYLDFVRTGGNRWRLAIIVSLGIISQYSGNAIFSNYLNAVLIGAGITDQNQKLGISTGKILLDCIVTITAATQVDRVGRRPLFLTAIFGMVGSCVCWTLTAAIFEKSASQNVTAGYAQLIFIFLFGVFYDIGFSGLLVSYALEVLPFKLRAKGMMIMNITIQATLALSNQTNMIAWDNLPDHWNFILFYTVWDFIELIFVYFVYVETKGPTLEEIARIFDGDDAIAHVDLRQVEKEVSVGITHRDRATYYPKKHAF
ncbi:hypothetical protein AJ79_05453 [Helicocarpus griseus UAMH5409]|uniref:Major facilitator superfamily (MFS) profile domain-containing protein n=1 Tax=Helicocarpus griseus UAMH5409 TaxID=1447875 RepID=A0A2B7XNL4_9EURO|nr:hypothetical protein AJ79_05453 [Helicocarpus griseus UAMH5409]